MTRAPALALALIAAAVPACRGKDRAKPAPAGRDAAVAAADARPALAPEVAALPGAIWFIVDGPPTALWRLARGKAVELGERLFPSAYALADGRQVAVASRGTEDAPVEQLALVEPEPEDVDDGNVLWIGPSAPQVRDPAVDPAGAWIAIATSVDGHSELYRIDLADQDYHRLTDNPEGNFHPTALGPDAIAFASSRDGDSEIYRCDKAGKHVQRLTAFYKDDWDPVASPDGKTIAFLSDREGPARIFLMAPDGTGQRRLTDRTEPEIEEAQPVWSPDGASIAYVAEHGSEHRVFVRAIAAGTERGLTPDDARDTEPDFSPDGAWIVVARATMRPDGDEHELWAIPVAGGAPLRLTAGGGREGLPRWVE